MHSSTQPATDLPEPDEDAQRRSAQVLAGIESCCVESGGLISFADFMHIALYHPGAGYYTGGLTKFGEQGDFITSPEVSPLFSQCVANQAAEVLMNMDDGCILEFGAGSGVMAADILLRFERLGLLPCRYRILEVSAELKQRQRETIERRAGDLVEYVEWLDAMPSQPVNAVVIANEILDAMPVECFRKNGSSVDQLVIGYESGGLFSDYREADAELQAAVRRIEERTGRVLPDRYRSELNLNIGPWLASVHSMLATGVVLLIDYGYPAGEYYLPERDGGTLVCHYRHRAHANPFWYPGLQDITAFVDFTDVAYCAAEAGFHVAGFTTQAAFLMSSGIADLHNEMETGDTVEQLKLSQQVKTLTLPSEMGEKFKVIALTKSCDEPLMGFMLQDHRGRL